MSEPDNADVRELKTALARAVEELEEQRVAAIELRMLLDASEARLRSMSSEVEEARTSAREAEEKREISRVEAIEMRMILDATEHRAARLEGDLALTRRDQESHGSEAERLAAELTQALGERQVLEGLLEEARARIERGDRAVEELGLLRGDFESQRAALDAGLQEARARMGELEERAAAAGRVEELEQQQAEATQRHTAAVNRYMLELNQRSDELRLAEAELARLREEVEVARQTCTDTAAELTHLRQENEALARRLREGEAARAPRPKSDGLRLADAADEAEPAFALEIEEEEAPPLPRPEASRRQALPLTVVHLEDHAEYREALEATVAQYPRMRYVALDAMPSTPIAGPCLVVANLLAAGFDPLAAVVSSESWGLAEPAAFTYCADAGRGTVLGMLDYFPEPFDADACAARLLAREDGVQRLLVVSDNVELMNSIRSTMARFKASTSGALDARQAFELAALVRPDLVLVDLGLPRGEGLRLLSRLRADAKTAAMPAALLWGRPIDPSDLRAHALRVARDTSLVHDDFKRAVQQTLNERGFRSEPLRETA